MSPLPREAEQRYEHYAQLAREEFEANWEQWTVRDVAQWWNKWCVHGKTTHDKLGRILMDATGVRIMPKPIEGL